jgi:WD40 repeat protein
MVVGGAVLVRKRGEPVPVLRGRGSSGQRTRRCYGKTLASGSFDNTVKLWDSGSGQLLRTLSGHGNGVTSVAWSPNGKEVASGSSDST